MAQTLDVAGGLTVHSTSKVRGMSCGCSAALQRAEMDQLRLFETTADNADGADRWKAYAAIGCKNISEIRVIRGFPAPDQRLIRLSSH